MSRAIPVAVHQFSHAVLMADGASNGMLFTQRILRELGFVSEIYAFMIDPALADIVQPAEDYVDTTEGVLLVHHTLGHDYAEWVNSRRTHKVLVYHNITPAHFFAPDHPVHGLSLRGRSMLAEWQTQGVFDACIGMSEYNSDELRTLGYDRVRTLPLLVDVQQCLDAPWDAALAARHENRFTVLFVGRIAPNKCQHDLLEMMVALLPRMTRPVELILVGGTSDAEYAAQLRADIRHMGLTGYVHLPGKVDAPELFAWYRAADVFVCLSEHEGFGMPLLEAMLFDVPVIAWDSSNVAATLGKGGLVCREKSPAALAALIALLSHEPGLRQQMIEGQRENLRLYDYGRLKAGLARFLDELGVPAPTPPTAADDFVTQRQMDWRIEGPFDRHYSLALVNREFARGLLAAGDSVSLHSTEGGGDFAPDADFLAANPDLAAAWERGQPSGFADVATRNCYPPRVTAMRGRDRWLLSYGWEESGFPATWVEAFNDHLTGITVMSSFVQRVLQDNGVTVPIAVVGLGADHVLRAASDPAALPLTRREGCFTFVHISSGFPRKGLDVLMRAWATSFKASDPVRLVVKTFANPHNTFLTDLAAWRQAHPNVAPVEHIDGDLSPGALRALYESADAFVGVARGEGFGLPLAEAMLFGVPVVASAHGGQRDFCTPETAWLVDYRYTRTQSHFGLFNSVWAEPDEVDLGLQLRAVFKAPAAMRDARSAAARALIESRFTWDAAVQRLRAARQTLLPATVRRTPDRVALVSSWNTRCGIADYAHAQVQTFPGAVLRIFANEDEHAWDDATVAVERCWTSGARDTLERLRDALLAWAPDAVVLQFNFAFFDLSALDALLQALTERGIACHIVLHATRDVMWGDIEKSLRHAHTGLSRCTRLMVHSIDDLNRLKDMGLDHNAMLLPHGIPAYTADADRRSALRAAAGFESTDIVLGSGGFLLPNKGYLELVEAFDQVRPQQSTLRLLLQTPEYPGEASRSYRELLMQRIAASPWRGDIVLETRFLTEQETLDRLAMADRLIYPTGATGESSSASVRWGLAVGTPVAVTTSPIFADVREVTYTLPGHQAGEIAEGLQCWLSQADPYAADRQRWTAGHRWPAVSKMLWNIVCATCRHD